MRKEPIIFQKYPCDYLHTLWNNGLFDEYSDDHFLIKALNGRLDSFNWSEQFINNNLSIYPVINKDRTINYDLFCSNFCINLSFKLKFLSNVFGADKIEKFIVDQLSAGKDRYDENVFFQALSEIEILSFFHRGFGWDSTDYEPSETKHGKNPEARFTGTIDGKHYEINIEVKTAEFPIVDVKRERKVIPIILENDKCAAVSNYCSKNRIRLIKPRVTKLVDFLNSACDKFSLFDDEIVNLLYINWSYSDFPSNSFLEPWSLMTNEINGILCKERICDKLHFRETLNPDFKRKISAIIVYTSSIEELMFSDFRHVWQRGSAGCKFRMWLIDETKRNEIIKLTGMNPDMAATHVCMIDYPCSCVEEEAEREIVLRDLQTIIVNNAL